LGKSLRWERNADNTITIFDVDYALSPAVTILELTLGENVLAR
jgi:hypothetical protein